MITSYDFMRFPNKYYYKLSNGCSFSSTSKLPTFHLPMATSSLLNRNPTNNNYDERIYTQINFN